MSKFKILLVSFILAIITTLEVIIIKNNFLLGFLKTINIKYILLFILLLIIYYLVITLLLKLILKIQINYHDYNKKELHK